MNPRRDLIESTIPHLNLGPARIAHKLEKLQHKQAAWSMQRMVFTLKTTQCQAHGRRTNPSAR